MTPGGREFGVGAGMEEVDRSATLGLLAGGGPLPRRVADAWTADGGAVFILGFQGHTDVGAVGAFDHEIIRLGAIGRGLDLLKDRGVRYLCMIGPIRRPSLAELRPDLAGVRLLSRIGFTRLGDDALLRAIKAVLAEEGFTVIGADRVLPSLPISEGTLAGPQPSLEDWADVRRGVAVVRALGAVDVGQAAVVQGGLVLAVEAIEGTDAMIARAGDVRRQGAGGVLVKLAKPSQDPDLDRPAIGPRTVEACAAAGLAGIYVEAGTVLVVDPDAVRAAADRHGLFVRAGSADPAAAEVCAGPADPAAVEVCAGPADPPAVEGLASGRRP